MTDPRSWRAYRRARDARLATLPPICHLCGQPVDMTIPASNKWGPTADHITPIAQGGSPWDPANIALAHRQCNMRRGDRDLTTHTTRDW